MIRVIDIDTTGIDPANDAIIEIASIDILRDGGITNAMDTLVKPGKPIPAGASAVHHIVDQDVANAPQLDDVIDRFRGADFYVAHNCEFESSFFAAKGIALWSLDLHLQMRAPRLARTGWPQQSGAPLRARSSHALPWI